MTNRKKASDLLDKLVFNYGISKDKILDWILNNYLSGTDSVHALELAEMEFTDHQVYNETSINDYDDHYNDSFYDKEEDVELDN